LISKSDPPPLAVGGALRTRQRRFLATRQSFHVTPELGFLGGPAGFYAHAANALRAFGADDVRQPGTPSGVDDIAAGMLARGQGPFLVWVNLTEHKRVTSGERRGAAPNSSTAATSADFAFISYSVRL
jgi:hypothetical protein